MADEHFLCSENYNYCQRPISVHLLASKKCKVRSFGQEKVQGSQWYRRYFKVRNYPLKKLRQQNMECNQYRNLQNMV